MLKPFAVSASFAKPYGVRFPSPYVNNCTDKNGGWALGCRIDGSQAEYVRVPFADMGLNKIPNSVSDEQALFVGDVLVTGFRAARVSKMKSNDTVLIIGAGPTGVCTLLCAMLKSPKNIIVCEKDESRVAFLREHYPEVLVCSPKNCKEYVLENSTNSGADVVFEVAGGCDCDEILSLIEQERLDTTPLITHKFSLRDIEKAYNIFENKLDGAMKIAMTNK